MATTRIPVYGIVKVDQVDVGMTCQSCVKAVTSALKGIDGVEKVDVSLTGSIATVKYNPSMVKQTQLVEAVEDCGFDTTKQPDSPLLNNSTEELVPLTTLPPMSIEANELKAKSPGIADIAKTTLSIRGMTCASCVANIEKMVSPWTLPGLLSLSVNLMSEEGLAEHDPTILSAEDIATAIDEVGFEASVRSTEILNSATPNDPTIDTATLKIFGMTCASCVSSVEGALHSLPDVKSALVNLATQEARVVYQSGKIGVRDLVRTVEEAGFDAIVADGQDNTTQLESLARTREIQEWRRAYQVSAMFAVPVFLVSMVIGHFEWGRVLVNYSPGFLPGLYLSDVFCLLLTIPPQFGVGKLFFRPAFKSLRHGSATMDVLVTFSTLSAFFFSCFAMLISLFFPTHTKPKTFFDTSSMLLFFVSLGRYLENRAKGQTSAALSRLMSLTPSTTTIYTSSSPPEERTIPTELLQKNDIVVMRPGDKVPADGIVLAGETYIDESMVTGEPMPAYKRLGDVIIGGTVNGSGRIDFRVLKAGKDTQLAQIVRMVRDAQVSKTQVQRFADVAAGVFVPFVLAMGLFTFIVWMVLSHVLPAGKLPMMFTMSNEDGTETTKVMLCLQLCISVIVVACPCALGLSTPTAVMVGTGVGAQNGILIKGGATLEQATRVTRVVFDKTGTLTVGKMSVAMSEGGLHISPQWNRSAELRKGFWRLVAAAESGSEHPIGKAIAREGKVQLGLLEPDTPVLPDGIVPSEAGLDALVTDFSAVVGAGVQCNVTPQTKTSQSFRVVVGSLAFLQGLKINVPDYITTEGGILYSHEEQGRTCVVVGIDGEYAGCIALNDMIKLGAKKTVAALKRMNLRVAMVSLSGVES
jgi:P-type Cu+ transporter